MKKMILVLLAVTFVISLTTACYAAGDQNQGDKGQGTVVQNQVRK